MLVAAERLTRHHPSGTGVVTALSDVTLGIPHGAFVAALGPAGSGKSTFLNLVGGLDRPTAGALRVLGEDLGSLSPEALAALRARRLGFLFQTFHLLPRVDLLSNVEMPLVFRKLPRRQRRDRAAAALARVGLGDQLERKPGQLSPGQQQRVAIARAIVGAPELILADEPTGALDSRTGLEIMALLQELHRDGIAVLMVTHDPDLARFAGRVLRFRDGRLLRDDPQVPEDAAAALAAWSAEAEAELGLVT